MNTQQYDFNEAAEAQPTLKPAKSRRSPFTVKNFVIKPNGECEYMDGPCTVQSGSPDFLTLLKRVIGRLRKVHTPYTTCRECGHYRKAAIPGVSVCTYCVSRSLKLDSTELLHIASTVLNKTSTPTKCRSPHHSMVNVDGTDCCESCHRCRVCKKVWPDVDKTLRCCRSCLAGLSDEAVAHIVSAHLKPHESGRPWS